MSAVATAEAPRRTVERPQTVDEEPLFGDGVTFEDVILGVWHLLVAEGEAACLVCGGSTERSGRCGDCGSELS